MRDRFITLACCIIIATGIIASPAPGTDNPTHRIRSVGKVTDAPSPTATYFDINNISTVYRNDGTTDIDIQQQNAGFVFPKGSHKTCVFQSGFLWGGSVGGEVRVGGTAYRTGMQGGKILTPGVAEDPNLAKNRIYRVRPDYKTGDLSSEATDLGVSTSAVRDQYELDWNQWPWQDGAPFTDKNGNGIYEPDQGDIPGVPGADMTIWYVANDLNSGNTTNLYGSNPIGIELQVTVWGYNQSGALGNMLFRRYLMINKGARTAGADTVTQMYVSQWADPDDGNATDDYAGCDTTLSLGYCYNAGAVDAVYSPLPPPAVGFDFFQGPMVAAPGDSAIFRGQRIYGKKNLPMTAFYYFARGDATVTDPTQGSYEGTTQFYNFFQGKIGKTGDEFTDPNGNPTTFALNGDPVTGKGWIDGQILPAGDRRIGLASGPFTLMPGDTQEVVVAEIAAGAITGVDRLTAISLLKFYDLQAQRTYEQFFNVTPPPPPPVVSVTELDKQIVLDWSADSNAVKATEGYNVARYKFQGYNVYQLPSAAATIDQGKKIATFDIKDGIGAIQDRFFDPTRGGFVIANVENGPDEGIQRFLNVTVDESRGHIPMVNGIRYYFAVTAYGNTDIPLDSTIIAAQPQVLEDPIKIITVVPHSINPEVNLRGTYADTILADHIAGFTTGNVALNIVNPSVMKGENFKIDIISTDSVNIFTGPDPTDSLRVPNPKWLISSTTTGDTLYGPSTNFSMLSSNPIFDGVQVGVTGAPFYQPGKELGNQVYLPPANLNWVGVNAGLNFFDDHGVFNDPGNGGLDVGANFFGSSLAPFQVTKTVEVRFNSADGQNAYCYNRTTSSGGAAFVGFVPQPFKVFDVTDPAHPRQIDFAFMEANGTATQNQIWAPGPAAANREYFFFIDEDYTATAKAEYTGSTLSFTAGKPVLYAGWYTLSNPGAPAYNNGDVWRIIPTVPISTADKWTYNTTHRVANKKSLADIQKEVQKVNVFPNPYYGVNTEELNKYQRFVTFTHLPQTATIRIFNLGGVIVRTLNKDDSGQFQRWDLQNENGLPVGSGLYIAYIDMPGIGTKIVKFSIIQEQQILDRF